MLRVLNRPGRARTVKPILPLLDAGECVSVRPISVYSMPGHERHVVWVMSFGFSIFEGEGPGVITQ